MFYNTSSLGDHPMQLVVVMDVMSAVRMVMMMSIILFQVFRELSVIIVGAAQPQFND